VPCAAALGGQPDFSDLTFTINGSRFMYGAFINALLSFLIVAAVVFFFVVKPVNALMTRRRPEPALAVTTRPCPDCLSEIPLAATRCGSARRTSGLCPRPSERRRVTGSASRCPVVP
jgi:large conductance mechanosensitive channel